MINEELLPLLVSRIAFVDITYNYLKSFFPFLFLELHMLI